MGVDVIQHPNIWNKVKSAFVKQEASQALNQIDSDECFADKTANEVSNLCHLIYGNIHINRKFDSFEERTVYDLSNSNRALALGIDWYERMEGIEVPSFPNVYKAYKNINGTFEDKLYQGLFVGWWSSGPKWLLDHYPVILDIAEGERSKFKNRSWLEVWHQIGGYKCKEVTILAQPLAESDEFKNFASSLCRDFYALHGGRYDGSSGEDLKNYKSRLASFGLTANFTSVKWINSHIMEGFYPMDLTQKNLDIVSATETDIENVLHPFNKSKELRDTALIFLMADNCD